MTDADSLHAASRQMNRIHSLGMDRDALLKLVRQESHGPHAATLFSWFYSQAGEALADDSAVELVSATRDPAALAEIVEIVSRRDPSETLRRRMWKAFLELIDDRGLSYGVRAQALHGALLIAQRQKGLLHQLKGRLTDVDVSDDPHFLRHVAKILGMVLAHSPEPEFRDKLIELLEMPESKDEAAMELGFAALATGFDATTQESAAKSFETALHWFSIASESSEHRVDAELYVRCVGILVKVQREGFTATSTTDIAGLADAAWTYCAYLGAEDDSQPSWLGAQSRERLHWTLLASKLGTLENQLNKKVWLNAALAIEDELLAVYQASRSILLKGGDTGLDLVIRPRLTASLLAHRRHLDELDQWIEENEHSALLPDAEAMRHAVEQARESSVLHRPFPGRSEGRTLQAIFDAGQVPLDARKGLGALLHSTLLDLSLDENPVVEQIVMGILTQMERNTEFSTLRPARALFTAVFILSVYFLCHRHETGTASDPDGAYLFIRRPDELPLENVIQRDYFRFLRMSGIRDHVKMEVRDQGAGRADVYFSASGVSTITEVKRTMTEMDHDSLLRSYGLQTAAYQTTNVTFGFLLVLDLWDRGGSQPHLKEQISLQSRTPPGQITSYDVVVMRVQGQRKHPHSLR